MVPYKPNHLLFYLGVLLAANLLIILAPSGLSDAAAFAYLFLLPGAFIIQFFRLDFRDGWMRLLNMVALSLVYVLLCGLAVNTLGPLLGVKAPLEKSYFLLINNLVLIHLAFLGSRLHETEDRGGLLGFRPPTWRSLLPHLRFAVLPVITVIGAVLINNGGSNALTMLYIAASALILFLLSSRPLKAPENLIASALYFFSLSLLFMASMRAWHITGYDISKEMRVFMLARGPLHWSMDTLRDPYNACLSITILPTLASQFFHLPDEYVYKFLFQCLFAFLPVALFKLIRNFCSLRISYLSTIFVIVQVWFFQNMPTLIRQEFSVFFFTMILLSLFDHSQGRSRRYVLAGLYGIGMVLSHYSTSFVAVFLFAGAFLANSLLGWANRRWWHEALGISRSITLPFVLFLLLTVLTWNALITRSLGGFTSFLENSSTSLTEVFTADTLSRSFQELLYRRPQQVSLEEYARTTTEDFRRQNPGLAYYPDAESYTRSLRSAGFADTPHRLGETAYGLSELLFKVCKILVNNVFIVLGLAYVIYLWHQRRFQSSELALLAATGFLLLLFLIIVPKAQEEYNIERLYFQMLIVWALFGVLGGLRLMRRLLGPGRSYAALTGIYLLLFLFYTGFLFNLTGGLSTLPLNNYGENYEKFYTLDQDVAAARWLGENYEGETIFTNSHGLNRLTAYSLVPLDAVFTKTLPTVISRDAIVFSTYINTVGGKALYSTGGSEYAYTYPTEFLDRNKDKVYSNGISNIYR